MRILAVSGSLQARSSNGALLHALAAEFGDATTATTATTATFTRALHELPPFNIDTDVEPALAAVREWRAELMQAEVVLFATPEYAFGIAGSLKNALDWVVGSGELVNKQVVLLGASTLETGAGFALEALERTIRVMSADVVGVQSIPFVRAKVNAEGLVTDEATRELLRGLARAAHERISAVAAAGAVEA
jgi:chromate reductase